MGKARRKARNAQNPQRIFAKGVRDVTQQAQGNITLAIIRINQLAVFILRNRIDGQIAAL